MNAKTRDDRVRPSLTMSPEIVIVTLQFLRNEDSFLVAQRYAYAETDAWEDDDL